MAKQRRKARERFARAQVAAKKYARQLRGIAMQIGVIVDGLAPKGVVKAPAVLFAALDKYSELIRPWAKEVGARMIKDVSDRNATAWMELGRSMGRELRKEIHTAPTGQVFQLLLEEQVALITSLPRKAAQRVHELTTEAITTGARAAEVEQAIMQSGQVSASRAKLIARTEVARTASILVQTRAEYVGSEAYVWRTTGDSMVRELHRKMEGKVVYWNDPPQMEPSLGSYHAGQGPNCRCFPEPLIPDRV